MTKLSDYNVLSIDIDWCQSHFHLNKLNRLFYDKIDKAKKIVLAFDEVEKKGLGVVSLGSKMIDPPVVKRALQTVDFAIATKLLNKNWKIN